MKIEIEIPNGLNKDTVILVQRFAEEMAFKLRKAEHKYGYTNKWKYDDWSNECFDSMITHLFKGDPTDVAIYCAFMWYHNWSTTPRIVTSLVRK